MDLDIFVLACLRHLRPDEDLFQHFGVGGDDEDQVADGQVVPLDAAFFLGGEE